MAENTPTLTEFLVARIAEDEASLAPFADVANNDGDPMQANIRRSLAECQAKRRIADLHRYSIRDVEVVGTLVGGEPFVDAYKVSKCATCGTVQRGQFACDTLRALALPYADHEDYREEWRP